MDFKGRADFDNKRLEVFSVLLMSISLIIQRLNEALQQFSTVIIYGQVKRI